MLSTKVWSKNPHIIIKTFLLIKLILAFSITFNLGSTVFYEDKTMYRLVEKRANQHMIKELIYALNKLAK